ncbi:MAG TPA: hypothetical protein VGV90_01870 [Solirubrobacteraceae bacterium]|nr:hypothetical protein [Solirubrobacteraceae bacterium]
MPRVDDTETLKRALDGDAMLLIVDNCEHVAGEAAAVVANRSRDVASFAS